MNKNLDSQAAFSGFFFLFFFVFVFPLIGLFFLNVRRVH